MKRQSLVLVLVVLLVGMTISCQSAESVEIVQAPVIVVEEVVEAPVVVTEVVEETPEPTVAPTLEPTATMVPTLEPTATVVPTATPEPDPESLEKAQEYDPTIVSVNAGYGSDELGIVAVFDYTTQTWGPTPFTDEELPDFLEGCNMENLMEFYREIGDCYTEMVLENMDIENAMPLKTKDGDPTKLKSRATLTLWNKKANGGQQVAIVPLIIKNTETGEWKFWLGSTPPEFEFRVLLGWLMGMYYGEKWGLNSGETNELRWEKRPSYRHQSVSGGSTDLESCTTASGFTFLCANYNVSYFNPEIDMPRITRGDVFHIFTIYSGTTPGCANPEAWPPCDESLAFLASIYGDSTYGQSGTYPQDGDLDKAFPAADGEVIVVVPLLVRFLEDADHVIQQN